MDNLEGLPENEVMVADFAAEDPGVEEVLHDEEPKAAQNKPKAWVSWLAMGIISALIGGAMGGWMVWDLVQKPGTTDPEGTASALAKNTSGYNAIVSGSTNEEKNTVSIIAGVLPGVVQVHVMGEFSHPGTNKQMQPIQASGSGFVYDQRGYVVTNEHVVDGGSAVEVVFPDGKIYQGEITGTDRLSDLAVIKIINPPSKLTVLPLADSDSVQVGQTTIAIGSPLGSVPDVSFGLNKAPTVTKGIVSAVDRTMPVMSKKDPEVREFQVDHLIQTDAP
ncbi:MAG: S1C family serine protease, partial [Bacillota bacterium]